MAAALGVLGAVFAPGSMAARASAQSPAACGPDPVRQGPLEVFPAASATNVALNSPVRAVYPAGYLDSASTRDDARTFISVARCVDAGCAETEEIVGAREVVGASLFFKPSAPWLPRAEYVGVASGVDGEIKLRFTTGATADHSAPQFGDILDVRIARATSECEPSGTRRVDVRFRPALDDGPPGDIEYLLYMTRGEDVQAPELVARRRNFGATDLVPMAFTLTREEAREPFCVAVLAVDGVGNVDADGKAACMDPRAGSNFEGCGVSSGRARVPPFGDIFPMTMIALALLRCGIRRARGA